MHWFDLKTTFLEWIRIARPGGGGVAFWNKQEKGAYKKDWKKLQKSHPREDDREGRSLHRKDGLVQYVNDSPLTRDAQENSFSHVQKLNR